ncbi:PREDICTED: probable E3 SUMO-protein ligase RNF212 [Dipodomys ordii]|uniref:Probable E3 SUMO-protein ligase RNF212 n=1 Tax=Dipodomys ordii TaxID=10020 RepID=A0A1S3FTG9_DIPOR|nr:PREDICTED: probable E3 SUMO-protein ligase RNF212 [Dipodomys ordii]
MVNSGKNECLICKVPCHTVLLSKHTSSDVQTLFMSIDSLCKKYSQETSQISEFQEKHRRRLLAFYKEKISQLEVSLRKSVLQTEQLQSSRLSQQTAFDTMKHSVSTKPNGYVLLLPNSSALERLESMEVDLTPPVQKPEVAAGPARISLISPPQDGRMVLAACSASTHLLSPWIMWMPVRGSAEDLAGRAEQASVGNATQMCHRRSHAGPVQLK